MDNMMESLKTRIVLATTYLAVFVIICDQASKRWAMGTLMQPERTWHVSGFLTLNPVFNHGLNLQIGGFDFGVLLSYLVAFLELVLFLAFSRWRLHTSSRLIALGIGLGMGGVISNLIDHVRFGDVLDFCEIFVNGYRLGNFNIGELAAILGVFLLILDALIDERAPDYSLMPANKTSRHLFRSQAFIGLTPRQNQPLPGEKKAQPHLPTIKKY